MPRPPGLRHLSGIANSMWGRIQVDCSRGVAGLQFRDVLYYIIVLLLLSPRIFQNYCFNLKVCFTKFVPKYHLGLHQPFEIRFATKRSGIKYL